MIRPWSSGGKGNMRHNRTVLMVALGWAALTLVILACAPLASVQEELEEGQLTAEVFLTQDAPALAAEVEEQLTSAAPTVQAALTQMPDTSSLVPQFATGATASSEYSNPDWSAMQATGAPNTTTCGDHTTAWTSATTDRVEWLELGYDNPVTPTQIVVFQSYNPGYVVRVEAVDTTGTRHIVYDEPPASAPVCPFPLTISVPDAAYQTQTIIVTVDQTSLGDWTEIDAVALFGTP